MEKRIAFLERRLKVMQVLVGALLILVGVCAAIPFVWSPENRVVRARGFVVVDRHGRERILIGAPIPEASNRIRTDTARARAAWAGRFPDPDQYMAYYAKYNHSMNGMLILDERGFDRLAVGSPTPDPNIGRRIGPSTGLQINDADGFERSGYGLLTVDGTDRVVLGLDSNRGTEAVTLVVEDGGDVGLDVHGGGTDMFLGRSAGGEAASPFAGLLIKRGDTVVYSTDSHPSGP